MKILYISNEDNAIGGASLSLLAMLDALKGSVQPVVLFRRDGVAAKLFKDAGYDTAVIPFRRATFRAKGLVRALRFIPHAITTAIIQRRCVRKCKRVFTDISAVHSNSGIVDIGVRIAAALGVPHIWHIREYLDLGLHTIPFPGWKHWQDEINRSDAVIAISPGLYNHLQLLKHPFGVCIPDAVCSVSDSIMLEPKQKYVAFVAGTLSDTKRPDEAIRIFAAAGAKGYKLKIVGNADELYLAGLRNLAESLRVASSVQFLPFTRDIKSLLSKAAAVLVCTDFEGMGRVCVESMFYGCPVIARNSGGSADLLAEGRGYLYDTVKEAASMLGQVLNNFPSGVVQEAAGYAANNFAIENYADKILRVYSYCNIDEH